MRKMNARLRHGRGLCGIALKSLLAAGLLALTAMLASAQTARPVTLDLPECCAKAISAEHDAGPAAPALSFRSAPTKDADPPATEPPRDEKAVRTEAPDFNRSIYYKNKLEFSLEGGWLPTNIPFVFARFVGIPDRLAGLNYTLVPFLVSVRWHMNDIGAPWIFRGNWDLTFSGSFTMIPRGAETRYWAYVMGFRRNFVQPNWKVVPYFEGRSGLGNINAKGPFHVQYAQGGDFEFTVMLGGGARYNLNSRYSVSAGLAYMHVSNLYMSEPKFHDYGINVYGPMLGVNLRLGKPRRESAQQSASPR